MGQVLNYCCGDAILEWRVSRVDFELAQTLKPDLPRDIEILFEVPQLGESVVVDRDQLRSAAQNVLAFLEDHPESLPRVFQFKPGEMPAPFTPTWGGGSMSGLRLPNDMEHWYGIETGVNSCQLTRMGEAPDGRGELRETRDIRNLKELVTTNMGTFSIRSRAAKSEFRPFLKQVLSFLDQHEASEVTKIVE